MSILHNEITIKASTEKIWGILTDLEMLEKYDPTVKSSTLVSTEKTGMNAKRKVVMLDGKNWFDEKIVAFQPHQSLAIQLTDCSFPIKNLKHTYRFEPLAGGQTKVHQTMEYEVKFGILGKLMDKMMIGKQFDSGIKQFFGGLKMLAER